MQINRTEIEVRYQETDQMGVVYHANYLVWFEIGRTKYIEQLGFKYDQLEKSGFLSPVTDAQITYKFPVKYGDTIFVETWLEHYDKIRARYAYRVVDEMEKVYVTGQTEHVVVKKDSFRPVLLKKVHPAWHEAYMKEAHSKGRS